MWLGHMISEELRDCLALTAQCGLSFHGSRYGHLVISFKDLAKTQFLLTAT